MPGKPGKRKMTTLATRMHQRRNVALPTVSANWNHRHENNRSRELKTTAWVAIPNRLAADSYLAMTDRLNGAAVLGAWTAIILLASNCVQRGLLVRDNGTPHDLNSIARATRLNPSIIDEAIEIAVELGLMETVSLQLVAAIPHEGAAIPHEGAAIPQDGGTMERAEGKGSGSERTGSGKDEPPPRAL